MMPSRKAGYAAIAGGLLWSIGLFGITFDPSGRPWAVRTMFAMEPWPAQWVAFMFVGLMALLASLVALSGTQAHLHPRLVWVSFLAGAAGIVMPLLGLIGILAFGARTSIDQANAHALAWDIWSWSLLVMAGGSALFALATWRTRVLSAPGALLLLGASTLMVATFIGGAMNLVIGPIKISWWLGAFFLCLAGFAAGWVWLGWSAVRAASSAKAPSEAAAQAR